MCVGGPSSPPGCRPERKTGAAEARWESGGFWGDRCVVIVRFLAHQGDENSGVKRASKAASCFQERKIKAGNVLVSDWPDLGGLLQLSILGDVGDLQGSSSSHTFVC